MAIFCLSCIMIFSSTSMAFAETGTDPEGNDCLIKSSIDDDTYFEEDDVNEFMSNRGFSSNKIKKQVSGEDYLNELKEEIASEYDSELTERIEEEIRTEYVDDPEYQKYVEEFDEVAIEIMILTSVKNKLDKMTENTLRSSTSTYAWVVAPNVNQDLYYYCGPASALQAIAGWGGYVAGSTNRKKMDVLANKMGTTTDGTSYTAVAAVLNQYASNYPYGYKKGSSMDVDEFLNTCYNSLSDDYAPIINCYTGDLPYYKGHDTGHFITISGADLSTEKVRLVDPNYRTAYFGIRTLSADDVFDSINYSNRRLISANI